MSFSAFLLLVFSVAASVGGQFFLKQAAMTLSAVIGGNLLDSMFGLLGRWQLWLGLICYGLGLLSYILLLSKVNLSVASPLLATSYVFAVLLGIFYFNESLTVPQSIGIAFILVGAVLLSQAKR